MDTQPTILRPLGADELAEDLKLLFDYLKLRNLALLGWSTGGGVLMKFAARYPEYVSRLILYHSIGVQGAPFYLAAKVRAKNIEELKDESACFGDGADNSDQK